MPRPGPALTVPVLLVLLAALVAPAAVRAEPPALSLPAACEPGRTCAIIKFMDHDPGPRDVDFQCGRRAPGNHKGTDFAVFSLAEAAATPVLAAAPGTVLGVRDGMEDVSLRETGPEAVEGRECGNGVVVDHGDGWQTQYCHLLKGSVRVRSGETVARGQELGRIGLSGSTELPHVHLSVRHEGTPVDPFTGTRWGGACGTIETPLWTAEAAATLEYASRMIYRTGFAPGPAAREPARADAYDAGVPPDAPALVLWLDAFGLGEGDRLRFVITAPDGAEMLRHEETLEKDHAQWFGFAGLRRRLPRWPAGDYVGEVAVLPVDGGLEVRAATVLTVP